MRLDTRYAVCHSVFINYSFINILSKSLLLLHSGLKNFTEESHSPNNTRSANFMGVFLQVGSKSSFTVFDIRISKTTSSKQKINRELHRGRVLKRTSGGNTQERERARENRIDRQTEDRRSTPPQATSICSLCFRHQ